MSPTRFRFWWWQAAGLVLIALAVYCILTFENLTSDARYLRIQQGMTRSDVIAAVGLPDSQDGRVMQWYNYHDPKPPGLGSTVVVAWLDDEDTVEYKEVGYSSHRRFDFGRRGIFIVEESIKKEHRKPPALVNIESFPENYRDAVRAMIARLKSDGERPEEFYAKVTLDAARATVIFDLEHECAFAPDAPCSSNPGGKCRTGYYDLKNRRVTEVLGWQ